MLCNIQEARIKSGNTRFEPLGAYMLEKLNILFLPLTLPHVFKYLYHIDQFQYQDVKNIHLRILFLFLICFGYFSNCFSVKKNIHIVFNQSMVTVFYCFIMEFFIRWCKSGIYTGNHEKKLFSLKNKVAYYNYLQKKMGKKVVVKLDLYYSR